MAKIRTISLWQPWATLVVIGAKTIETRGWNTTHRGQLAIHAAQHDTIGQRELCQCEPFRGELLKAGYKSFEELPLGAIIGRCELSDTLSIDNNQDLMPSVGTFERAFGDYSAGRFAWRMVNPQQFVKPIPARGRQGFWIWQAPRHIPTTFHRKPTIITGVI